MKVVLSGATGFIGYEVLTQCLNHPSITSVIALTRRDLNLAANSKVKVIKVKDFTSYDEATVDELRTADAAIWCMGTNTGDQKVDIEYPLTFIKAIKTRSSASTTPFRYVHVGGAFTEPPLQEGEQGRHLWFYAHGRRTRGAMETRVMEEDDPDCGFVVYMVKPGAVLSNNGNMLLKYIIGDSMSIQNNELGAAMIDLAVNGNEQKLFNNQELLNHGRKLLEKST